MNRSLLITAILVSLISLSFSIHIQINNIHHGYKTTIEAESQVFQKQKIKAGIILTNVNWEMNQLEPSLIPFFNKVTEDNVLFDLTTHLIQGVFDEQDHEVIVLVFKQNTSIVTTITLRPHPNKPDENLSEISQAIKTTCQWSEESL